MSHLQRMPFEICEAIFGGSSVMSMLSMGAATEGIIGKSPLRSAVVDFFANRYNSNVWSLYVGSLNDFIWRVNEPFKEGTRALWLARRSDPWNDNELLGDDWYEDNVAHNIYEADDPEWALHNFDVVPADAVDIP